MSERMFERAEVRRFKKHLIEIELNDEHGNVARIQMYAKTAKQFASQVINLANAVYQAIPPVTEYPYDRTLPQPSARGTEA